MMTDTDTKTFLRALLYWRDRRGLSSRALSLKAGQNPGLVSDLLSGRAGGPQQSTVNALARALQVSPQDLAKEPPDDTRYDFDNPPSEYDNARRDSVVNSDGGGLPHTRALRIQEYAVRPGVETSGMSPKLDAGGHSAAIAEWTMPADMVLAHTLPDTKLAIMRVQGDSMEPEFISGDRVLVDTTATIPSPPGIYVVWDGYGLVLKRLEIVFGTQPPVVRMSCANAAYSTFERPMAEVPISGRVVGKWAWK